MGTIVNVIAILVGATIGMFAKKLVNKKMEESIQSILGVSTVLIGILGVITSSITVNANGTLSSNNVLLLYIIRF